MGNANVLTAQSTDGANAVHLHPEASSSSHRRLPATPPHLALPPNKVQQETGWHFRSHNQSAPGKCRDGASGTFCYVIVSGRSQDQGRQTRPEQSLENLENKTY